MSEFLPDLHPDNAPEGHLPSTLLGLLNNAGARQVLRTQAEDTGLAEQNPFPFLALVGQTEMRIALMLTIINPAIGGVLLIGPRGTGKTTAVRSLNTLLPEIEVSNCPDGCMPADYEREGEAGVCNDCLAKIKQGIPLTRIDTVKLIELPLNARLDDVVGGINERMAVQQNRVKLERGILSRADQNLLYIDEVNLLEDTIVDAILDAAAAGAYTVRRGAMAGTYRSRLVLIGSMNPEEGKLRPQLMDRFGLRINVRGLMDPAERREIYERVRAYRANPRAFMYEWAEATVIARAEVTAARELLRTTVLTEDALSLGLDLVRLLDIDSHRAEYTMFEAARAHAAADNRTSADVNDLRAVAPLALRQRRSDYMVNFFNESKREDDAIRTQIDQIVGQAQ